MKITIEVPDITTAAIALNNACIAYGDIVYAIELGAEVPSKFNGLRQIDEDVLRKRFECVKNIYTQIEKMEKEVIL